MKKLKIHIIKLLQTTKSKQEKPLDVWLYGYYACSSLCMIPLIDLSENNKK